MRGPTLLLALLALFSISSAGWLAQFPPQSGSLNLSKLSSANGTALLELNEYGSASFHGTYGRYSVRVGETPEGIFIEVEGENASFETLAGELRLLMGAGVLNSACDPDGLRVLSYGGCAFCNGSGGWLDCAQISPPMPQIGAPGAENAPLALPFIENVQKIAERGGDTFGRGMATSGATAQDAGTGGGEAYDTDTAGTHGIGLEHVLQALAVVFAVVIASYLILQQRQAQESVDVEAQRLLANETRAGIMQELASAEKIPTDLSAKLGKSKATIVEHLGMLMGAGLVEKLETPGRKFVYYRLTRKGKQMLLRMAG